MNKEIQKIAYKLNEEHWSVEEEWEMDHIDMHDTHMEPHIYGPYYTLILKEVNEERFKEVAKCILEGKTRNNSDYELLKKENEKLRSALKDAMEIVERTKKIFCME